MSLITRFTNALRADDPDAAETRDADSPGADSTDTSSRLFRCTACAKTYVTRSMETCPDCEQSIEGIPNERDLGMV